MPIDPVAASRIPEPHRSTFDRAVALADLQEIARFPGLLREVVAGASEQDLSRTWREGSWTVAQLVHHILDSHIHSYTRCKFALCETNPSIKPYDENPWVTTPDCTPASVEETLDLLELLHRRWVRLLTGLDESAWNRSFHPPRTQPGLRPVRASRHLRLARPAPPRPSLHRPGRGHAPLTAMD